MNCFQYYTIQKNPAANCIINIIPFRCSTILTKHYYNAYFPMNKKLLPNGLLSVKTEAFCVIIYCFYQSINSTFILDIDNPFTIP